MNVTFAIADFLKEPTSSYTLKLCMKERNLKVVINVKLNLVQNKVYLHIYQSFMMEKSLSVVMYALLPLQHNGP